MIESTFRPPTEYEAQLLDRLLKVRSDDRLTKQRQSALVRTIDTYGSFAVDVTGSSKRTDVSQRPYAEAQTNDVDGVPVWITLFTRDGTLDEVEIVRADGSPLLQPVSVRDIDVFEPIPPSSP